MSVATPFDDLTSVTRELSIPALDIETNFFPVDAVSDNNAKVNNKGSVENIFSIKKNCSLPAVITYKTFNVKKVSTNPNMKQVYPSASNKGKCMQWKTEYYERNTQSDATYDEPVVIITQIYTTDGSSLVSGSAVSTALLVQEAAVRSLGKSTDAIDTVQLDRMSHGGTAPVGIR